MSLTSTSSKATFLGNGSTGPFSFAFSFNQNSDIKVSKIDVSGNTLPLTEITDYVLTGYPGNLGGSVALTVAANLGEQIVVQRVMALTQPAVFPDGGAFFASSHENAYDRLTMQLQQVNDLASRAIRLPLSNTGGGDLPDLARAGTVLSFDGNGNPGLLPPPDMTYLGGTYLDAGAYSTLALADAAAAATGKQLVISSVWNTVPAVLNSHIWVLAGGRINNAGALMINGSFVAGRYQVFGGAGAVSFGVTSTHLVYPEWWGAKADGATASAAPLQAALNSCSAGAAVYLLAGTYMCSTTINLPAYVKLYGVSQIYSILSFTNQTLDGINFVTSGNNSFNTLRDLCVTGAKNGFRANYTGHITMENVYAKNCVIGFYFSQVVGSMFTRLEGRYNGTGIKIDFNGISYSDQNVWNACVFAYNTGVGFYKIKGLSNVFNGLYCFNNTGIQMVLEDDTADNLPDIYSSHLNGNDLYNGVYLEGYYGNPGLDLGTSLLSITGLGRTKINNLTLINYVPKSGGIISLNRSMGVRIEGVLAEYTTSSSAAVTMDRLCVECTVDIQPSSNLPVAGSMIGGQVPAGFQMFPSDSVLSNTIFTTPGGGGADVLASWTEIGATGELSLDGADLVMVGSTNSLKVIQPATAVAVEIDQLTPALTAGGAYWLNLTYKCDTGQSHNGSPIEVCLQNAGSGYANFDFVTNTWSNAGMTRINLPLSNVPYTISIPFTAPAISSQVNMRLIFDTFGQNAANAVYHVYEASISTQPNRPVPAMSALFMPWLPIYASNATALAGGLKAGMPYRNGDVIQITH